MIHSVDSLELAEEIARRAVHPRPMPVLVEVNEAMFSDEIKNLQSIERELERSLRETLGVATQVKLVEPKGIQRSEGKAVRVIDKRKI